MSSVRKLFSTVHWLGLGIICIDPIWYISSIHWIDIRYIAILVKTSDHGDITYILCFTHNLFAYCFVVINPCQLCACCNVLSLHFFSLEIEVLAFWLDLLISAPFHIFMALGEIYLIVKFTCGSTLIFVFPALAVKHAKWKQKSWCHCCIMCTTVEIHCKQSSGLIQKTVSNWM